MVAIFEPSFMRITTSEPIYLAKTAFLPIFTCVALEDSFSLFFIFEIMSRLDGFILSRIGHKTSTLPQRLYYFLKFEGKEKK